MREILKTAGFAPTWRAQVLVLAAIGGLVTVFLAGHRALVDGLGLPGAAVQAGAWGVWLVWLAVVFPRSHSRSMTAGAATAYRRAFVRHIVPGFAAITAINFAPAASGVELSGVQLQTTPERAAAAALLIAGGLVIVGMAVRAIGLPAAAFVEEYHDPPLPQRPSGIYAALRHPICVGGMMAAAGTAVAVSGARLDLVVLNLSMIVVYGPLEDVRLRQVFGHSNDLYVEAVRRFVPLPSGVRSPASRWEVAGPAEVQLLGSAAAPRATSPAAGIDAAAE